MNERKSRSHLRRAASRSTIVRLIALGVLLVGFAACGGDDDGEPQPTPDLNELKLRMADVLNLPNVVLLDLDSECDCISVGVSHSSASASVEAFAARVDVPTTMLKIEVWPEFVPLASLQDSARPLIGGLAISTAKDGKTVCTMTTAAYSELLNTVGVLTASHCTEREFLEDQGLVGQPDATEMIGREALDPPLTALDPRCPAEDLCRYSDAALIEPSVGAGVGQIARPLRLCMGGSPCDPEYDPAAPLTITGPITTASRSQDVLFKLGSVTGFTGGVVVAACVDLASPTDPSVTLLCQHIIEAGGGPGDSGAPVFSAPSGQSGLDVRLAGMLIGGSKDRRLIVISPIQGIEADLGPLWFDRAPGRPGPAD